MKSIYSALILLIIIACNNNTSSNNTNSKATNKNISELPTNAASSIVGSWTPIALDFNLDSIAEPSGKWIIQDVKEREAEIKAAGLTMDYGDFTFNANGTGFIGGAATKDNEFTYKQIANNRYEMKANEGDDEPKNTNAENVETFYLDAKGQLIFQHSEKQLIMGKNVIQNSFELYKRK
jgi:hypothetical protein